MVASASLLKIKLTRLANSISATHAQLDADVKADEGMIAFLERTLAVVTASRAIVTASRAIVRHSSAIVFDRERQCRYRMRRAGSSKVRSDVNQMSETKPVNLTDVQSRTAIDSLKFASHRNLKANCGRLVYEKGNLSREEGIDANNLLGNIKSNLRVLTSNIEVIKEQSNQKNERSKLKVNLKKEIVTSNSMRDMNQKKMLMLNSKSMKGYEPSNNVLSLKDSTFALSKKIFEQKTHLKKPSDSSKLRNNKVFVSNIPEENPDEDYIDNIKRDVSEKHKNTYGGKPFKMDLAVYDSFSEQESNQPQMEHVIPIRQLPSNQASAERVKSPAQNHIPNFKDSVQHIGHSFNLSPILRPIQTISLNPSLLTNHSHRLDR